MVTLARPVRHYRAVLVRLSRMESSTGSTRGLFVIWLLSNHNMTVTPPVVFVIAQKASIAIILRQRIWPSWSCSGSLKGPLWTLDIVRVGIRFGSIPIFNSGERIRVVDRVNHLIFNIIKIAVLNGSNAMLEILITRQVMNSVFMICLEIFRSSVFAFGIMIYHLILLVVGPFLNGVLGMVEHEGWQIWLNLWWYVLESFNCHGPQRHGTDHALRIVILLDHVLLMILDDLAHFILWIELEEVLLHFVDSSGGCAALLSLRVPSAMQGTGQGDDGGEYRRQWAFL